MIGFTLACFECTDAAAPADGKRPNFLIMLADDMCWRDVGFVGHPDVKTPALDGLAAEGMSLFGMYSPASTCSPTRHALYTGMYCVRAGAFPNETRAYDGVNSVFTHLQSLGYRVALQNKEHVGPRASFPYEYLGKDADDFSVTEEFLSRDRAQPWLLVFASNDPHSKWNRGPPKMYDPNRIKVPEYLHDNATTRELLAAYYAEITRFDEQVDALLRLLDTTGQSQQTMVLFFSEQGSSFPFGGKWTLYENGIRATAIVRWPGQIERGSRCDALMQYVDVAPTLIDAAGGDPGQIDCGCPDANGNRGFDGRSFLSVLTGQAKLFRDYVYAQHTTVGLTGYRDPYPIRSVRGARYKLICNLASENRFEIRGLHGSQPYLSWQDDANNGLNHSDLVTRIEWLSKRPPEELYDLKNDPLERHNLAGDPSMVSVRNRLHEKLQQWMHQQSDEGLATERLAKNRQSESRRARDSVRPWERPTTDPSLSTK
tara:strand:+ start:601354 stop:602808 length:1455 start_codon:yes stop_codon:yes gene_type:complete